jgi:LysM repeat protein
MEGIIDKLIELEYKAQKITMDAKEKEKTLSQQIQIKQQETQKWVSEEYQKKIEQMKKAQILEQNEKLEQANKKKLAQLEAIQQEFEQNHLNWENAVFNSIIGW